MTLIADAPAFESAYFKPVSLYVILVKKRILNCWHGISKKMQAFAPAAHQPISGGWLDNKL